MSHVENDACEYLSNGMKTLGEFWFTWTANCFQILICFFFFVFALGSELYCKTHKISERINC